MASGFKFSDSKKELLKKHYKEILDDEMIDYLTRDLDKKAYLQIITRIRISLYGWQLQYRS